MTISILLVDDNTSFMVALRRTLERIAGVKIIGEAHQGFEALAKAELLAPDLMLLDIVLPSISGLEVARRVQTWKKQPRIILLSAQDLDEYRDSDHDIINAEFVEKTDVVNTLIPIIERMVEART
jgi:DNA-binding NarL/FixJ family response regulator